MKKPRRANIAVFITDQKAQAANPYLDVRFEPNQVLGFVVQVYKRDKSGKLCPKPIESFWTRWRDQAESMAQEYHRQYGIMAAFGWR